MNVPSGYTKSLMHTGNAWTITNKTDAPPLDLPTTPAAPLTTQPADHPDDAPPTGDTSRTGLWLILALCSLAGLLTVTVYGKKKYGAQHSK